MQIKDRYSKIALLNKSSLTESSDQGKEKIITFLLHLFNSFQHKNMPIVYSIF